MNLKFCWLCLAFYTLNFCINLTAAFSEPSRKIVTPAAKPTKKMSLYLQEKGKQGELDRDLITCDFGDIDYLNTEIREEQINHMNAADQESADEYVTGLKKYFYLVNNGNVNIEILAPSSDPFALGLYRVVGKRFIQIPEYDSPYTIKPNEKVELVLAFDYTSTTPGKVEKFVQLGDPQDNCFATFKVKANLKSGIEFSPEKLDFGPVNSGTKSEQYFYIKLDRRLPQFFMGNQTLKLATADPYIRNIRITSFPALIEDKYLKVSNDGIFIKPTSGDTFDKDRTFKFRVEVLNSAPIGKINQKIKLSLPESPNYLLLGDAKLQVNAEVIGSMNIQPSNPIAFGTLRQKTASKKVTFISCEPPLTLDSLCVVSSNKYITAHLIMPPKTSSTAKLELVLSPNAPVGQQSGKITVTNTINKDRIEINANATITK